MTIQEIIEVITSIKNLCNTAIDDKSVRLTEEQQGLLDIMLQSIERMLEFLPQYEEDTDSEEVSASLIFDLRSPLNAITTASDFLLNSDSSWNHASLSKLQEDNLRRINNSARQILEFILSVLMEHRNKHFPHEDNNID